MKKTLLLCFAFLLVKHFTLHAQCVGVIPYNAVVVNTTTAINGGFDPIWVCPADTLISDGGFHNIFLEPGAVMLTGGGIDTVYVKNGAKFFMQGGIHVVYYLSPQDVFFGGGIPTKNLCDSLKFDYKSAPLSGCITTGVADVVSMAAWPVSFYNHNTHVLEFDFSECYNNAFLLQVTDALGRVHISTQISSGSRMVSLSGVNSGIYFCSIKNASGNTSGYKLLIR